MSPDALCLWPWSLELGVLDVGHVMSHTWSLYLEDLERFTFSMNLLGKKILTGRYWLLALHDTIFDGWQKKNAKRCGRQLQLEPSDHSTF